MKGTFQDWVEAQATPLQTGNYIPPAGVGDRPSPEIATAVHGAARREDLDTVSGNVFKDILAVVEMVEELRESHEELQNSVMEQATGLGAKFDRQDAQINALLVSFEGLLKRVNAVEEAQRERTRNLVKSIDLTDEAVAEISNRLAEIEKASSPATAFYSAKLFPRGGAA